jgi:hypothetical protein
MFDISKNSTQRILKDNRQHAYHYTRVQNLLPEDLPLRVQFCEWLLQQHEANPNLNVFSQETEHNYHVWADENPRAIHVNAFQHRFNINLWAGILGDSLASVDKQTRLSDKISTRVSGWSV